MPTYNRPTDLDRCLRAIEALQYSPENFEVLVVDDGSDPPPDEVLARHSSLMPLRSYRHHNQGPARSRNLGLREARGTYVVFTDDDCAPDAGWLEAFDRAFVERPRAGLGGRIVDAPDNGICARASQMLISFLYEYDRAHPARPQFFCSNNLAFPRKEFLDIGGFDESFPLAAAEDRDVCNRWIRKGELCFVASATVQHRQNLTFTSFCSQHFRYGRGAFHFWSRRDGQPAVGARPELLRFYAQMLAWPFSREKAARAIVIFFLLLLSQVANAAGYFAERLRCKCLH